MNPGTTLGARIHLDQTTVVAFLVAACVGLAVAWVAVAEPGAYRLALAALLTANLLLISARWPRAAAIATLAGLPFLALTRRLLIPEAGWGSEDPLLLVAPLVAIALVYRLFAVEQRPLAPDRLSKLVLALFALTLLQTLNPVGAGFGVNAAGLLFVGVPLLWFFIGRELANQRTVIRLGAWIIVSGSVIALYGLWQTNTGLPSWDQKWVDVVGVAGGGISLLVGDVIRPFGTFSSATEYAQYIAAAFMAAFVFAIHRRLWAVVPVPLLAMVLFLASVRTTLILALVASVVIITFRAIRRPVWATTASILVVLIVVGSFQLLASTLQEASQSRRDLVEHQLGGVANPLDSEQSTLAIHAENVRRGMAQSFDHPLGQGNGVTTQAATTLEADSFTTEVDLSDAFVRLGLIGGVLYLAVIATAFSHTARLYWQYRGLAPLLVLSALIVAFGQWLNGGHYAVSAMVWFLLGWAASQRVGSLSDSFE